MLITGVANGISEPVFVLCFLGKGILSQSRGVRSLGLEWNPEAELWVVMWGRADDARGGYDSRDSLRKKH